MICSFFGHRDTPDSIRPILRGEIVRQFELYGVERFYVGNQGRFDAMVKSVLRELSEEYPNLKYDVVLAYLPHGKQMDSAEDTVYPEGLERVPRRYAIAARNKWMVERSDVVICYIDRTFGGAAQFAEMAEKKGKKIINLADQAKSFVCSAESDPRRFI